MKTKREKQKNLGTVDFILFFVFCLCLAAGWMNLSAFGRNPREGYTFENISSICSDLNGGKSLIHASGYEITHINTAGEIDFVLAGETDAEDGFYFAQGIAGDSAGNLYVHSKEMSEETSFAIRRESIKKFSPEGEYLETSTSIEHSDEPMKCEIVRMQPLGGSMAYFTLENDKIVKHICGTDTAESFGFINASKLVRDVQYSEQEKALYVITYTGIVGKLTHDGGFVQLYNAPETDNLSVPWQLSLGEDGGIYVCDIGLRTVQLLDENGYNCHYFDYAFTDECDPEIRANSYIEYVADASNGFMTVNSDEIIWEEDGEILVENSFPFSTALKAEIVVFYVAAVLGIIILLYFAVLGAKALIKSNSSTVKMSSIVISLTLGVALLFVALTFGNFNDRILEEVHMREDSVALALDKTLPTESFKKLNTLSAYYGEDYLAVKESVDNLLLDDNGRPDDLYCVLYSINNGVITSRYTLEEAFGINYPYDWDYIDSDEEYIMTTGEKLFYSSLDNSEGNFMFILNPLHGDNGEVIGLIEIGTDLTAFSEANRSLIYDLLINILVMSVVIVMIAVEIIAFVNSRKKFKGLVKNAGSAGELAIERIKLLRIVVFAIFFITNITTGFLSYYALNLAQESGGFLGLPPEILAAFPISAEVLTGAIFSVYGSFFIRILGRRNAGILGGVLFTAGLSVRFVVTNLFTLTLGNAIQGCGWGIVLLIANTMIAEHEDEGVSQDGFVGYNSALQNGMNSGIVFGGFLVQWMSYRSVLLIAAVSSVFVALFSGLYFANEKIKHSFKKEESGESFIRFIFRPRILLYFLGIVIPVIAAGYYLNYLYPIIGEQLGMKDTYIGYSYLLNGLAVICCGNMLVRKLSRRMSMPAMLVLASSIYLLAFTLVGVYQSVPVLLVALVILGISDSFGYSTQTTYYSELSEVKKYGYSKAMGVYSLFENISQTAGSFLFGYVLVIGLKQGLIVFGGIIFLLALIFMGGTLIGRRRQKRQS